MTAVAEMKLKRAVKRLTGAPTIGADVDLIWSLREKKRGLESEAKKIEEEISTIEERLMESMKAQNVEKATGTHASVSIGKTLVANVEDWDKFLAYVYKNKYGHLLQRRVSDPAWREVSKDGTKVVPGVQPFNKTKLNLRSLTS